MFFKNLKNKLFFLLLTLFIIPFNVYAYSDYIIAGGENIGIKLNSSNVIIVGTYEVNNISPAKEANLKNGDRIISVNDIKISTINEMIQIIEKEENKESINIEYQRGSKTYETKLNLVKDENDVYKTGLYVKDSISGIGTLTYIDPNTKLYGALGHEIIEKNSGQKIEVKDGKIYNSTVTGITKSKNGIPGEKNAKYNTNIVYGDVLENTKSGIFGNYKIEIPNKKLYKVANKEDIKIGDAKILTVIKEEAVEAFDIKILKVSEEDQKMKNILFEIIDEKLLEQTGGIVQGMSGSPIVQDDYIIGAVTHVVVDKPHQGYGIFITNMLEESEN